MVHFIIKVLGELKIGDFRVLVCELGFVKCEKVGIFGRRNHRRVPNVLVSDVDETRSEHFEVEVKVDQSFALVVLGNIELELLLIPSFTDPADVFEKLGWQNVLPFEAYIVGVNLIGNKGMQRSQLFVFNNQEPSGINKAVVTVKVESVNRFVGRKAFSYDFGALLRKVVGGKIHMMEVLVFGNAMGNAFGAFLVLVCSEVVHWVVENFDVFVFSQVLEYFNAGWSSEEVLAQVQFFEMSLRVDKFANRIGAVDGNAVGPQV